MPPDQVGSTGGTTIRPKLTASGAPRDCAVERFSVAYDADGTSGKAQATLSGDQREAAADMVSTLSADNATWGPFTSLGDWQYDPAAGTTTLTLVQARDESLAELRPGQPLSASLAATFPGTNFSAIPSALLGATYDPGPQAEMPNRRDWFNQLLGPLGFRLIADNAGQLTLAAPATEDKVFKGACEIRGFERDASSVPRQIIVTGAQLDVEGTSDQGPLPRLSGGEGGLVFVEWDAQPAPDLYGWQLNDDGKPALIVENRPGAILNNTASASLGPLTPGAHRITITPLFKTTQQGSVIVTPGQPGPEAVVSVDQTFEVDQVTWQATWQDVTVSIPAATGETSGSSDMLRVTGNWGAETQTVLASRGSQLTIRPGGILDFNVKPGDSITLKFADASSGKLFGDVTVTLPNQVIKDVKATAKARSAAISWTTSQPGTLVTVEVLQGDQRVYLGNTTRTLFTIANLRPKNAYTVNVYPTGGVPENGAAGSFTTEEDGPDLLSEEEIFEVASDADFTTTSRNVNHITTPDGSQAEVTIETTNTKRKQGGNLVHEDVSTTQTTLLETVTPDGRVQRQPATMQTVTSTDYRYDWPLYPHVQTGHTTLTTATVESSQTVTRVTCHKRWHPKGWLQSTTTTTTERVTVMGGEASYRVDNVVETWTRTGKGWAWSRLTTQTTKAPVIQLDAQGAPQIVGYQDVPVTTHETSSNAAPPEMVTPEQGTPIESASPQQPEPAPTPDPAPLPLPGGGTVQPGVTPNGPTKARQQQLRVTRAVGGPAAPMTVSLDWVKDPPALEAAADHLVKAFGRPKLSATRVYAEPVGAKRGGAVESVSIQTQGAGNTPYAEEVVTVWREQPEAGQPSSGV